MKIFLLADYYPSYLKAFYASRKMDGLSYTQHRSILLNDYFGSFCSYHNHFKRIGHDVELVIGNDALLQAKWLAEHRIESAGLSKYDVVLRQIEGYKPDIFFMGSMFDYYGRFLEKVSDITPNIFVWISCPYSHTLDLSRVRCVISSNDIFVQRFRSRGLNAELLRVAFDSEIVPLLDHDKTIDVSFIGALSKKTHRTRVEGLEFILNSKITVKTFGYGLKRQIFPFKKSILGESYGGERWGIEMYRTLGRSKISLNSHIDVAEGIAGNMRLFEATGCGTLLMTENTVNLGQLFHAGTEVIAYDSVGDLADKIRYYLQDEAEREKIAQAGQRACLERHGYDKRILEFENIIQKHLI